jgi:predicted cupin superfamily sugar epimerase
MVSTAREIVERYELLPHPEGGYYREVYRAKDLVLRASALGTRSYSASTSILYLLEGRQFSALHRISSDELWHFYEGNRLRVVTFDAEGNREDLLLGRDMSVGERYQAMVPAGRWFGATLDVTEGFCLVGCTVAPGFEFSEFELGQRDQLLAAFPRHRDVIESLTRAG